MKTYKFQVFEESVNGSQLLREMSMAELFSLATFDEGIENASYPVVRATGRQVARIAAVASVAAYTVDAADSSFWVSVNVNATVLVDCIFGVDVNYTDETNAPRTLSLGVIISATGEHLSNGQVKHIRAKAGTTITISTSGTFTNVTYNVEGTITQIS